MAQSVSRGEGKGETVSGRRREGKGKMEEEFNQCVFFHSFLFFSLFYPP